MNNDVLAEELVNKTFWWRYASFDEESNLSLSPAFNALFDVEVTQFDDMMGCYRTPIINLKVQEILKNSESDVRFIASYHTLQGKRSFQHQLHVYSESGKRYVLANCMDVTEMVALEREIVDAQGRLSVSQLVERQSQLEEQNRIINESYQKQSRFLALLSHELRSPLLGISSLVQRLRLNQTDEEVLSALKAIHITAEQSTFLVNDILTYSQTEYDEITLHPMRFSLKETLHNVKQLTSSIAADKGLIVSLIYLGEQDEVVGDSVRLSQILINLIVNSIKFTQYGGVTIEVIQVKENKFSFKITDSGEGIAEDQLERIFEPYAQLESIGSTQSIGSGLGLLVVQKLISLMGGGISVQSILGVGTSFQFDLLFNDCLEVLAHEERKPLEGTTLEAAATKNSVEQFVATNDVTNISNEPPNILIADDSKINLMVLGGYLQELNCSVVEAKNGREAWELFQKNTFDYVFLDIQMPFLDGIEVSHKIKACVAENCSAAKKLKKVFAVTAGGDESNFTLEGEPVGSNGFDHWFVKPVTKEQIVTVLQEKYSHLTNTKPDATLDCEEKLECVEKDLDNTTDEKGIEDIKMVKGDWEGIDDVPESFHRLITEFLSDLKIGIEELERFVLEERVPELIKKAHYLKGNCMLLQLNGMVSVLREIEEYTHKNKHSVGNKQKNLHLLLEKLRFGLKYLENSLAIRHNA